jgi:acyl carrier protein
MDDFATFAAWLAAKIALGQDPATLGPDTSLTDLELDSLQLGELWVVCEDLGLDLPEELFFSLQTVGDLHHYYLVKVPSRGSEP